MGCCVADGGCNGYEPGDEGWGRGNRPVINVNWNDAKAYVTWLSRKSGKGYRLLSEAEREYVTRAGTSTPFWWGSSITPNQANYRASGERTVPVDTFEPNPWGLYNVHGNVLEWSEDCRNDNNTGNPGDGRARTTGDCTRRMVRGGSWVNYPEYLRSAYRSWDATAVRSRIRGFRLVRTLGGDDGPTPTPVVRPHAPLPRANPAAKAAADPPSVDGERPPSRQGAVRPAAPLPPPARALPRTDPLKSTDK